MSKSGFDSRRVTALLVLLVVVSTGLGIQALIVKPEPGSVALVKKNKIHTELTVSVYDAEGNLKSSVKKPDDLLTAQFIGFLATVLKGTPSVGSNTVVLKNDANADKTIRVQDDIASFQDNSITDSGAGSAKKGGIVGIGTGSTAPARSDYSLETKVEAYSDITSAPVWDPTAGTISLSGNVAITGSRTITEAILGVKWRDTGATDQVFIFARDTFAGQAVVNTDVVAVSYVITLTGSEFTNNFGVYLSTILTTCNDGQTVTYSTYKNIANSNVALHTYIPSGYANAWSYNNVIESRAGRIYIGTGSTAVARTDYYLGTKIQSGVDYITQTDSTGITINGSFNCLSATTINEVGLTVYATAGEIMFFRLLTPGDAVTTTDVYLVEIRIDC